MIYLRIPRSCFVVFFEDYKKLEHKNVIVEKIVGKEEAFKIINESLERYKQQYIIDED